MSLNLKTIFMCMLVHDLQAESVSNLYTGHLNSLKILLVFAITNRVCCRIILCHMGIVHFY